MYLLLASCAGPDGSAAKDNHAWSPPWIAPDNRWPSRPPPEGLVGEGFDPGEVVPDARAPDQHGDLVSTWQFSGLLVLVSVSATWCAPCQDLAPEAEALADELGPRGFLHLTVIEEDAGGLDASAEDAEAWADAFGVDDQPVLGDALGAFAPALRGQYPALVLVGPDLVVRDHLGLGDDLRERIEAELPE